MILFTAGCVILSGCGVRSRAANSVEAVHRPAPGGLASERMNVGPRPVESYEGAGVGGLSQDDYESAFAKVEGPVTECLMAGAARLEEMGGHMKVVLRVDREGNPLSAYMGESAIGDRETEKCVLDVFRSRTWPRPKGGDGLAERTFSMEPATPPSRIERHRIDSALLRARNMAASCRRGLRGRFAATMYVGADGRVIAAGIAPPDERGEAAADCIVGAIKKIRIPRRSERAAKVSFTL